MGLLPIPGCEPDSWPEGCSSLYMQGWYLLQAALSGLTPFFPPDDAPCEPEFNAYISLNQPVVDVCDSLIGWVMRYGPNQADAGTQARSASGRPLAGAVFNATWQFELWEAAYPNAEGADSIRLPTPDLINEISRHIYSHGLSMYHAVTASVADGELYPDGADCSRVLVGDLLPLGPMGACAGWKFNVTAEILHLAAPGET